MITIKKCGRLYFYPMINVTKTYLPEKSKYLEYVDRIYQSGWLTNNGEIIQELEKRLADYLDVPYIIPVANGTLALQVAARLLDIKGEVITTPFSFVATTSSLAWEGLKVRFADINPDTFNMDPGAVEALINDQTSAIVPVHVFGNTCEVEKLEEIAGRNKLKLIYDAAHAFGVKKGRTAVGNFGDVSVYSFHSTKLFHTIEGGAIVVKDKALYERAKLMINFGISGPEQIDLLGINAKMNEFEAAMGLCILDDIDKIIQAREKIYNTYVDELVSSPGTRLQKLADGLEYNFAYFPLVFPSERKLIKAKEELEVREIFPRRYFYPSLSTLGYLEKTDLTPVSDDISKRILCLPLYGDLPESVLQQIIEIIKREIK